MPPISPADGPVAVTGASGYVGAHIVLNLVDHGYHVRCCVRDATNPLKYAPAPPARAPRPGLPLGLPPALCTDGASFAGPPICSP